MCGQAQFVLRWNYVEQDFEPSWCRDRTVRLALDCRLNSRAILFLFPVVVRDFPSYKTTVKDTETTKYRFQFVLRLLPQAVAAVECSRPLNST